MRELGFSEHWPKLQQDIFTTFRFTRKDKDWKVSEIVKVVFKPRSKQHRAVLGVAEIVGKEPRWMAWDSHCQFEVPFVTNEEANTDGFPDRMGEGTPVSGYYDMWAWLSKAHGLPRFYSEPMNKLTLRWRERAS